MKVLLILVVLLISQFVCAANFPYSKSRAKKETKYIINRLKGLYSNENGMAREYVSPEQYQKVITAYENIVHLIKQGNAPVLQPKEIRSREQGSLVIAKKMTLVIHAYGNYDYFWTSSAEIDRILQLAQTEQQSIGFIVSDPGNPDFLMMGKKPVYRTGHVSWMTQFKKPDFALVSPLGSHNIIVTNNEVTVVGGYWDGCLTRAVKSLVWNREETIKKDSTIQKQFKINLNLKGIYRHYYNVSTLVDSQNPQSVISLWNANQATLTSMPRGLEDYNYKVRLNGTTIIDNVGTSVQEVVFNIIP